MQNMAILEQNRGQKEYDSNIKNIEGILSKVKDIIDVSKYYNELNSIKREVSNLDINKEMFSSNMQLEYEAFIFSPYIERLEILRKKIEEESIPFYELNLLTTKIDEDLRDVSEDNINEIIRNTKNLINSINNINTHNREKENHIVSNAYKTIYKCILKEEILNRDDILTYINYLSIKSNKENIGRLLEKDIKNIKEKDLIDYELSSIKLEGLGFDYLTPDIIKKVSEIVLKEEKDSYDNRKYSAVNNLRFEVYELNRRKKSYDEEIKNNKKMIKNLKINKALLTTKLLSIVLIPVCTFTAGRILGTTLSNNIDEYKTITRTVDSKTGEIIGDVEEIYDEKPATYASTVKVYSPWKQNPTGKGYIRNITAYEYNNEEEISFDKIYENVNTNGKEKYRYVESKDTLLENDSTTEVTILITETYQNKEDTKKSTKFIIPLSLTGVGIGIVIDVLLIMFSVYSIDEIKRKLKKLDEEIKDNKLDNKEITEKLNKIKEETLIIKNNYEEIVKKYGHIEDNICFDTIETKKQKKLI